MEPFGSHVGLIWAPGGSLGPPEGVFGTTFSVLLFSFSFLMDFGSPGVPQSWGRRHGDLTSGGMVKHHFGTNNGEIWRGTQHFVI